MFRFLSKHLGYFKTVKSETGNRESGTSETGNREPGTSSLFLILVYNANVLKVQNGNKELVPCSFLTLLGFILVCGFVYVISMQGM